MAALMVGSVVALKGVHWAGAMELSMGIGKERPRELGWVVEKAHLEGVETAGRWNRGRLVGG